MSVPSSYMEVGEGELPYNLGYIGKCGPKEYGFSGVLVINRGLTLINSSLIVSITKFRWQLALRVPILGVIVISLALRARPILKLLA